MTIDYITQSQQGADVKLENRKIRFTSKGVVGSFSFNCTISDGYGGTDTASVTVGVIDPVSGEKLSGYN